MATITIKEAQETLTDLIHRLSPGEEVQITENDHTIAVLLVPQTRPGKKERILGTQRGSVLYMAPDFDAPLDDFKEYLE